MPSVVPIEEFLVSMKRDGEDVNGRFAAIMKDFMARCRALGYDQ